jgi:drug/metabolite transporter (DMT)-like permease
MYIRTTHPKATMATTTTTTMATTMTKNAGMAIFLVLLLANTFTEVAAQYMFKKYHMQSSGSVMGISRAYVVYVGVCLYAITGYLTFRMLERMEMSVVNVMWHVLHFLVLFVVGYLFLGEKVTPRKVVGCILGVLALVVLMTGAKEDMVH